MKFYTGIGSRETPPEILEMMKDIASKLELLGWTLRSGGAPGADTGFENGVKSLKEIYVPWRGFNGSDSELYYDRNIEFKERTFEIASENHPAWKHLKDPIKKLMARNVYQILGWNLNSPSKFVICWTQDGCESHTTRGYKTGGTGLAISVASKLGIPIFNLKNESSYDRVMKLLKSS